MQKQFPQQNTGRGVMLLPIAQTNIPPNQRAIFARAGTIMMLIVGFVLLIACANVANLLLARATARRREISVRVALGASRWRLVRQLLTESLILGVLAGAFALMIAYWARGGITRLVPGGFPQNLDISIDGRVLGYTLGLSLVATILFGLMPALQASGNARFTGLSDRSALGSGAKWYGLRGVLVMLQVAFSLIILVGAGLFVHSLINAQQIDPGFETKHAMTMFLNMNAAHYPQPRAEQFYKDVVERVKALPMVQDAAVSDTQVLGGNIARTTFPDSADTSDPSKGILTPIVGTGPGYFSAAGITLQRGRDFTDHDDAPAPMVAIVNQAFADRTWGKGVNPVGHHLHFALQTWDVEIVGLVSTVKYNSLGEPPTALVYMPLRQHYMPFVTLFVRMKGDPSTALTTINSAVKALDPALPQLRVQTVQQILDNSLNAARIGAEVVAIFGFLALLLAAIGTYGVVSYGVSQRTQEFGVRMALGAQRGDLLKLVIGGGMAMVAGGVVVGLALSAVLSRAMNQLLFGIGTFDAASFLSTAVLLIGVAMIACLIPARRATKVDPVVALRYE